MKNKTKPSSIVIGLLLGCLLVMTNLTVCAQSGTWITKAPISKQRSITVLLVYDMEGVTGINDWRMFLGGESEQAAKGRDYLVGDVNAVIAGLFDGGVTAVDVLCSHGGSTPDPNVPPRLDPRARTIIPDGPLDPYLSLAERGAYDAIAAVGAHDKPLSGGFAAHTFGSGLSPVINGRTLTETELLGYSYGDVGIPVIFVSGDDRLKRDLAESMPWILYVVTKRATGLMTADLLPEDQVWAEMRTAAKSAVQQLSRMRPMRLTPPIQVGLRATFPMSLPPGLRYLPGLTMHADTVTFTAPTYLSGYRGIRALVGIASASGNARMLGFLRGRPEVKQAIQQYWDSTDAQLAEFEDGKWQPPPAPEPPTGRAKFHRVP